MTEARATSSPGRGRRGPGRASGAAGPGVGGSLASVASRTTALMEQLEGVAGEGRGASLLRELRSVGAVHAVAARERLGELRRRMDRLRAEAAAGAPVEEALLVHLRDAAGRLHEAHWLTRRAAQRASVVALDLRRLCGEADEIGASVGVLSGLGAQTDALVARRRPAAA